MRLRRPRGGSAAGVRVAWPAVREKHVRAISGQGSHQSRGWSSGSQHQSWVSWEGWSWRGSGQS
eukprot:189267-Pyramimonas_sp.AAC.1